MNNGTIKYYVILTRKNRERIQQISRNNISRYIQEERFTVQ